MNITAIVAEYNPFHLGHLYQIKQAKLQNNADYCIVIMSGNFVQRGIPAFMDKYSRAKMALLGGADVVIELPTAFACGSAERFARGAIGILDQLNCVTHLSFGSEHGDISLFQQGARLSTAETTVFQAALKESLKKGLSFPKARALAFTQCHEEFLGNPALVSLFEEPNNILGIEYCKALSFFHSSIIPTTIKREGGQYHEQNLSSKHSSASAIRTSLQNLDLASVAGHVTEETYGILEENWLKTCPIFMDDCSLALHQMLLHYAYTDKDFTKFSDISKDFSDKIIKNLPSFTSFSSFCDTLKSKDLTSTRITRNLISILLGITASQVETFQSPSFKGYAKLLGFKKEATPLLNHIKVNSHIPLISKNANASSILETKEALDLFLLDVHSSNIYNSIVINKYGVPMKNEYTTSPTLI